MKRLALILLVALLAIASGSALAHGRGRVTLGFHFGGPLGWYHPWYYAPPPVYYYPSAPVVVQPPAPTTYVERSDVVPEGTASWYFCRESNGYYPYVKACPGGWERVPARPPQ
ncbi:MAG TPA: hypothetical protein VIQ55_07795 [Burkholderiales bacterium]|jgi:hypothetical protein